MMDVTFNFKEENGFFITSPFSQDRGTYIHSGNDYYHEDLKKTPIINILNGVVDAVFDDKYFGNVVRTKHNLKYLSPTLSIKSMLFFSYCHLFIIEENIKAGDFLPAGKKIGLMGNSGKSKTRVNNGYRFVTPEEIQDPNSYRGVHLHLSAFQVARPGQKTTLLKKLIKLKLLPSSPAAGFYFYQWGRLYYSPRIIKKFLELQNE